MSTIASQVSSLRIVYSTVYSDADQRKHQSSASLAFVWGIHRGPVNSPHKWPVTRKIFPFDDGIMKIFDAWPSVYFGFERTAGWTLSGSITDMMRYHSIPTQFRLMTPWMRKMSSRKLYKVEPKSLSTTCISFDTGILMVLSPNTCSE